MTSNEVVQVLERIEKLLNAIVAKLETGLVVEVNPEPDVYTIYQVEHYISNSGNPTWKAYADDGSLIYLRQANKELLIQADLWSLLNEMSIGETWKAEIEIEAIQDGDFLRPVKIAGTPRLYAPPEQSDDDIPDFGTTDIINRLTQAGDEL